jgi:starch synthase
VGKPPPLMVTKRSTPGTPRRAPRPEAAKSGSRTRRGRASGTGRATASPLHVVFVASEAHPFASTGGLAEVVGALPPALASLGHRTTIILPQYRQVARRAPEVLAQAHVEDHVDLPLNGHLQPVTFRRHAVSARVEVIFVDAPELFDREGLYTTAGRPSRQRFRFAAFSRAALEFCAVPRGAPIGDPRARLADRAGACLPEDAVLATIRSSAAFPRSSPSTTSPSRASIRYRWFRSRPAVGRLHVDAIEFWGNISFLKAGINFSERITTVSPKYAKEIQTPSTASASTGPAPPVRSWWAS